MNKLLFLLSSADHHSTHRPIPRVVLWYRHRRHSSTRWFVSRCLARASGNKLTFPLCRICVQEEKAKTKLQHTHYYHHPYNDRMLPGSWCSPELVKKGYTLVKIHKVWHFPENQRGMGLFADYINT